MSSLSLLSDLEPINGIIQYKRFNSEMYYYPRVYHDPFTAEEVMQCLYLFIPAVIRSISHKEIPHGDLRVPNICFDSQFATVLIDFDFSHFNSDAGEVYLMILVHLLRTL